MKLPFTTEQFFAVFRAYNEAVWPAQVVLHLFAILALAFMLTPQRVSDRVVSGVLAFLWVWLALAYHLAFFAIINPLAYAFAAFSLAGGFVFFWVGVIRQQLHFRWQGDGWSLTGALLIGYSLIIYPLWSSMAGHPYPSMPTFGLPCPTTLFTIGMLSFLRRPFPRLPLIVPNLWTLIGSQAAFLLGVTQDLALLIAGGSGIVLLFRAGMRHADG